MEQEEATDPTSGGGGITDWGQLAGSQILASAATDSARPPK